MHPHRGIRTLAASTLCATLLVASACGSPHTDTTAAGTAKTTTAVTAATDTSADATTSDAAAEGADVVDDSTVHDISVTFNDAEYDAMIETYNSTGDKEWIYATVTIDGSTYENVGIRLKGNSSLRSSDTTTQDPASLPWLVKLDKYVEDQSHHGLTALVIRSNGSQTALNEAVALELLERAGLASQDAMATSFSVNGGEPVLRLAIEHPNSTWIDEWFGTDGSLYKAESTGDYSYRGDDPAGYDEVFDLEAGDDEDLVHLTDFLEFINEADDETFAAELDEYLDVEAFARYLAMMELLDNFDGIDGPGNNSYLYYDPDTGKMTVVAWDLNLAFGTGMGAMGAGPGEGELPDMANGSDPGQQGAGGLPDTDQAEEGRGGGPAGSSNILAERFLADETFAALYDEAMTDLQAELFDSGVASEILAHWVEVLESDATHLIDTETIETEADQISSAI